MMMSGKQYSLDSRIDLVEAVQASQDEEDQENVARTEDTGMINLEGEADKFDTSVFLKKSRYLFLDCEKNRQTIFTWPIEGDRN